MELFIAELIGSFHSKPDVKLTSLRTNCGASDLWEVVFYGTRGPEISKPVTPLKC